MALIMSLWACPLKATIEHCQCTRIYFIFFSFCLKLMIEYKERRRIVDEMKDELQNKITEYSKLVESGVFSFYNIVYVCI